MQRVTVVQTDLFRDGGSRGFTDQQGNWYFLYRRDNKVYDNFPSDGGKVLDIELSIVDKFPEPELVSGYIGYKPLSLTIHINDIAFKPGAKGDSVQIHELATHTLEFIRYLKDEELGHLVRELLIRVDQAKERISNP